ncbi:hypothetical protein Paes_1828 [Prosthecochloris aestuarii DSM 271]|uniref:Uncharacterized protein n=1 Tax=Prosthecochloris aestuarii (strain DSM 271 / SK 413) TaxID=290512 RepID=B4S448_PROA2|nr:hypothetical protein Paes_1828 [Prosthecochloris aestuarii DSM 271]
MSCYDLDKELTNRINSFRWMAERGGAFGAVTRDAFAPAGQGSLKEWFDSEGKWDICCFLHYFLSKH